MSYSKDLDEYTEDELLEELHRRKQLNAQGKCDYCGRPAECTVACKFPARHATAKNVVKTLHRDSKDYNPNEGYEHPLKKVNGPNQL